MDRSKMIERLQGWAATLTEAPKTPNAELSQLLRNSPESRYIILSYNLAHMWAADMLEIVTELEESEVV
jgi:hypothetical protein